MKIMLMTHPVTIYQPDLTVPSPNPPLGIAYIASYLQRQGYEVSIFDTLALGAEKPVRTGNKMVYGLSEEEILGVIAAFSPDIVGISSMYSAYSHDAYRLAKAVKQSNRDIKVVIGGAHASTFPDLVARLDAVDAVVCGEGEETFLELVQRWESGKTITDVPGIVFRLGGKNVRTPPRPFFDELDSLPFPARELLPMDVYTARFKYNPWVMRKNTASLISSRGCPGDCVFCSVQAVWGRKWRGRSARNVVDEIQHLVEKYGIGEIHFMDDNLGLQPRRLEEICDEIIRRKIDIKWATPNGISHWLLDKALLDKMKKSGCYRLTFGLESGDPETRQYIGWKKNASLEQARRIIRHANKIGLWTIATFILGFPYEDGDAVQRTINFAIDSDVDLAQFYPLKPYPGTRVYEAFKVEGLLDYDAILQTLEPDEQGLGLLGATLASKATDTRYFTADEVDNLVSRAYRSFWKSRIKGFLNPLRIWRKIKTPEGFAYALRIAGKGLRLTMQLRSGRFSPHNIFRMAKKKEFILNPD